MSKNKKRKRSVPKGNNLLKGKMTMRVTKEEKEILKEMAREYETTQAQLLRDAIYDAYGRHLKRGANDTY